jgi:integrase
MVGGVVAAGIEERHARSCRTRKGGRCYCAPTYQANVWDGSRRERHRKTFATESEARAWRKDALIALRRGRRVSKPSAATLEDTASEWLEGARKGTVRTRSGDPYKPAAIRSYERSLRLRVYPQFGQEPLADVRRVDLQGLIEDLTGLGLAPSTIEATVIPLRAIFRRELSRGRVAVNPTTGLELPKGGTRRERIADPAEAVKLLAAVPEQDRAVWATAMYAGLRRGELMALRVDRIDLAAGVVHVERGWDDVEGEIETKGRHRRRVPIPEVLRSYLSAHQLRSGRRGRDLIFGRSAGSPFDPRGLTGRADDAWRFAKLARITLHECRHTFASLMIAANVNAKALSTYMGHANIAITYDRYGHLMPGNEDEAAGLLDAYLTQAEGAANA